MMRPKLLNIGSGPEEFTSADVLEVFDVTRLDINEEVEPDIVANAVDIPCKEESFDGVLASHVLEHIDMRLQPNVLEDWYKLLRPGGQMFVMVPNGALIAEYILKGMEETGVYIMGGGYAITPMDMIFGLPHEAMQHHWLFTRETLAARVINLEWKRGYVHEVRVLGSLDRTEVRIYGQKIGGGSEWLKMADKSGDKYAIRLGEDDGGER